MIVNINFVLLIAITMLCVDTLILIVLVIQLNRYLRRKTYVEKDLLRDEILNKLDVMENSLKEILSKVDRLAEQIEKSLRVVDREVTKMKNLSEFSGVQKGYSKDR